MFGRIKMSCAVVVFAFLLCAASQGFADRPLLRMATTTSTENTGLLSYLSPHFQADTGIEWQWVAVGTGKALELGKNCDVDVLLVHAPDAETKYVAAGYGIDRRQVMYNDFIIIGPKEDPAGVKGLSSLDALKAISQIQAVFASRGDDSGTHKMELSLWEDAGLPVPDKEPWYVQTGQGMLNTIVVAAERGGYTLTDRGTYITYEASQQGNPPLVILVEGDPKLYNQYSVMAVNKDRCSNIKYDLAMKFIEWIVSPPTQKLIADFKVEGKQLFVPNAN